MNQIDIAKLSKFPKALDSIVNEKFNGAKCQTSFSIVEMSYVTVWNGEHKKTAEIRSFLDGFMAGNQELSERLQQKGGKES